jgi:hypothetical protein
MPLDSPLMEEVEYLQLRGLFDLSSFKPYDTEWIINGVDEILIEEITLNAIDKKTISLFSPLLTKDPNFSYLLHLVGAYQNEPELYTGFLDERLSGKIIKHLGWAHGMRITRANEIDSLGPKPWNDFQVYLNEGFLQLDLDKVMFDFGRRDFLLGPGDIHSLLLSSDRQAYDGFFMYLPARYYEFHGIFTILDATASRFLSVHRLGFKLERFLHIGFSEAILSSGSLEPMYLNFFFPYYLAQWGSDRDDNIMWAIDLQLRMFNSMLYAELLIDDYMYEDDPNNPYPHKLAYQVGLKSLLLQSLIAKINYTFVDKWVYTQREATNVYERNGHCLGFPLGNDVDELSFSLRYENKYGLRPRLEIDYIRKGEGSIYVPYEVESGPTNPPFPSGIVEKTFEIKCGIDYTFKKRFYVKGNVGKVYKYNEGHISDNDREEWIFDAGLWLIL